MKKNNTYPRRRLSLLELAQLYKVSKNTIRNWLVPFQEKIGKRIGRFYTPAQVDIIFELLEPPFEVFPEDS